jgi:hypothetical protein
LNVRIPSAESEDENAVLRVWSLALNPPDATRQTSSPVKPQVPFNESAIALAELSRSGLMFVTNRCP